MHDCDIPLRLEGVKLITCVGVGTEEAFNPALLAHFARHYLDMGILEKNFLITLQTEKQDDGIETASDLLADFGICASRVCLESYDCYATHEHSLELLRLCSPDDWVMYVDADEFVELPEPLSELLLKLGDRGDNAVSGLLLDRMARNGYLAPVRLQPSIWEQYPVKARFTRDVLKGFDHKVCLFRSCLRPNLGHHLVEANAHEVRMFHCSAIVHHFKWDSGLPIRTRRRYAQFNAHRRRYPWFRESAILMSRLRGRYLELDGAEQVN